MRTVGMAVLGFVVGIFVSESLFGRGNGGLSPVSVIVAVVCAVAAAVVDRRSSTTR